MSKQTNKNKSIQKKKDVEKVLNNDVKQENQDTIKSLNKDERLILKGVRFKASDLEAIESKAKALNLSFSEYIRLQAVTNETELLRAEKTDDKLTKALGYLTRNSNKISKIADRTKLNKDVDPKLYAKIHEELAKAFLENIKLCEEIRAILK